MHRGFLALAVLAINALSAAPSRLPTGDTPAVGVQRIADGTSLRAPQTLRFMGLVHDSLTGANGWYGVCDVPREGVVQLAVYTPSDSTDRMDVRLVGDALNHQLLYLGSATVMRVAGVVMRDGSNKPIADATVSVPNGPSVRMNAKG